MIEISIFKIAAIIILLFAGFHFIYRALDPFRFRSARAEFRDFTIGWICIWLSVVALGYTLGSL